MTERTGYKDIARHYRDLISDGELAPGDQMPTVNEVAAEHGVSRGTAARAYELLGTEGYIVTRAGAGTTVAKRDDLVVTGFDRLDRFARTGRKYSPGEDSTGHQVWRGSCRDADICRAMNIDPDEEMVFRVRTFRREGRRIAVGLSVINPRVGEAVPEISDPGALPKPWQSYYTERTGRQVVAGERIAWARQASQAELDALAVDAPMYAAVPVLVTSQTFHDEDGPIEHWEDVYAPSTRMPLR